MRPVGQRHRRAPLVAALALLAAACGGGLDGRTDEGRRSELASLGRCPDPVVIQTGWYPRAELGALYQLTAGEGRYDADEGRFRGPLAAEIETDADDGDGDGDELTIEIRSGGPGFDDRTALEAMIDDDEVFLATVDTDEAIDSHGRFPTIGVVAPLDVNPQIVMWDPDSHEIESWVDLAETEAMVSHTPDAGYIEYLLATDLVDDDQLVDNFSGSPTRFIGRGGELIQEGFATEEPYVYENVLPEWGRPVGSLLVHDTGYEIYQDPLAILADRLDADARACLSALVPLIQQAVIDYQRDPTVTAELLVEVGDDDTDRPLPLTDDGVLATVVEMGSLEIVGNGHNSTVGDFDFDRIDGLIELLTLEVDEVEVGPGLQADDLVTNEFIDPDLGL